MRLVIPLPATAPENLLQIQIGTKGGWSGSYNAPKGTATFEVDVKADGWDDWDGADEDDEDDEDEDDDEDDDEEDEDDD